MNTPFKISFKMQNATGRYRSFQLNYCDIKVNKHEVGTIAEQRGSRELVIRLQVKDATVYCGWKWVSLRHRAEDFVSAKAYVKENLERILRDAKLELKDPD